MVRISIICLIYKSTKLCDWVYNSIIKYTPLLKSGEAEFFFVANDPTANVVAHLYKNKYPFIINNNKKYTEDELFEKGYGIPEYMNRVYKGYNQGILHAKGERIVLINSDNFFSPDWLENLIKYSDSKKVISSAIVERNHEKFGVFPGAIESNFGGSTEDFKEDEFINFTYRTKKTGLKPNGAYMPCLLYRDVAIYAGLYPEGNIAGKTKEEIFRYGDEYFFDRLANIGVEHFTAKDSIVYHLKEGEREDVDDSVPSIEKIDCSEYQVSEYNKLPVQRYEKRLSHLQPISEHENILLILLNKRKQSYKSFRDFLRVQKRTMLNHIRKIKTRSLGLFLSGN
ncbi:hypothetical protein AGMMS50268_12810 [Spirochaetia bacterium]|nr:hypothetical protein AGMMS50268_12810 [Spirochaetia bacterium]